MNTVHPPSTTISQTNLPSLYPQPPLHEHKEIPVKQLSNPHLMVNSAHSPEQYTRASDGTFRKVAITAQNRLVNSTGFTLQPGKTPEKTPVAEVLPVKNQQLHGIFELINQRLTYMEDVALFKDTKGRAVEDLTREKNVLEKAKRDAMKAGLTRIPSNIFFRHR